MDLEGEAVIKNQTGTAEALTRGRLPGLVGCLMRHTCSRGQWPVRVVWLVGWHPRGSILVGSECNPLALNSHPLTQSLVIYFSEFYSVRVESSYAPGRP